MLQLKFIIKPKKPVRSLLASFLLISSNLSLTTTTTEFIVRYFTYTCNVYNVFELFYPLIWRTHVEIFWIDASCPHYETSHVGLSLDDCAVVLIFFIIGQLASTRLSLPQMGLFSITILIVLHWGLVQLGYAEVSIYKFNPMIHNRGKETKVLIKKYQNN